MAKNKSQTNSQAQLLKGSAWMTIGSILSRILGAIYIIPWYAWMGKYGNLANSLTAKSYNIYSLFIIISTAGIPGAIAKQIAKYNALNEYGVGRKLFRHGLALMGIFGIISAACMYFLALPLSGFNPQEVPVIRSLALAVLIIPILSILRGYFQGFNDMMPSAMSQFVEQLARVIWMLLTAYVIMRVQHGNYVDAVTQSNLAAAIGAVFGIGLLVIFHLRQKRTVDPLIAQSNNQVQVSTNSLLFEIIQQSIPFIIIDSGINIFQLVDQYTFHPMIASFMHVPYDVIEIWYALFGLNANKLIMIVVSLSTAMAVTAIPLLSGAHARRDYRDISRQIGNTLELFLFVLLPASLGMAAISDPLYTIFYGYDRLGAHVLYLSSFTAISLGMFTVLMAILQGLDENMYAIRYLIFGLVIKAIVQYPMIRLFKVYGPLLATNLGLLAVIAMSLKHLSVKYRWRADRIMRRFIGIASFSIVMFAAVFVAVKLGGLFLSPYRRLSAMLLSGLAVAVGVLVYGVLSLKTGLAENILGSRVTRIMQKFR
ncbi:putative polysaccharide biosynthesis protein [Lactobacillus delbrueckii]|uniref:putative polysaccharide biosynthesis protein n=1 Tax=Lactobacillus delbrueckii TaxID=1584 RepID=UPI0006823D3F|nr:polysaccharide biosynthesis protein [Lactobacillus delbrueckii]APP02778.1 transporter [Lactobacillus delbrueckii subsp. indicus]KNE30305.1 transporter [Lactobacillus delbrueckii subsp. indicus]KRL73012.1 polysaccharide biosynthesis protein [Lactobacillus delbrueckii subsp. indicus DSM 15996]TXG04465.1 polysaccharide biosynthesis protein [Lactobacillus delbrueckii subsp. bulgaricus]